MQYTKIVLASFLYLSLFACNSGQVTETMELATDESSNTTRNTKVAGIPMDGKLRDEHLQMYVSIQIILEQIRYQRASSGIFINNKNELEEMAIGHFEYDSRLYQWVKKIVENTSQNSNDTNYIRANNFSSPDNSVIAHNLSKIRKFRDELRFVKKYKLNPNLAQSSRSSHKESTIRTQVFPLKTSS